MLTWLTLDYDGLVAALYLYNQFFCFVFVFVYLLTSITNVNLAHLGL